MLLINEEYELEKQIDRACSAQSPEMLPEAKVSKSKIKEAQARIEKEKAQYKVPASQWRFDQI
jgi:hypothetical protein